MVVFIPYFFDTNVIISFVFSYFEKTGPKATSYMTCKNHDKFIGQTV